MGKKTYLLFLLSHLFFISVHAQNFELIDTWAGRDSPIENIQLAPDGNTLIVAYDDGTVAIWDIDKKMLVQEYHVHQKKVNSILFNRDKNLFVTAGDDAKIVLWEYPVIKVKRVFSVRPDINNFAVITPNNEEIYFGGYNTRYDYTREPYTALYKVNVKTGKSELAFNPETLPNSTTIITDGNLDYSGKYVVFTKDKSLIYFDLADQTYEKSLTYDYFLNSFIFLKDKIYAWGDMMLLRIDKTANSYTLAHKVLGGTRNSFEGYSRVAITSDEKLIVTGDDDKSVNIWDTESMIKKQILLGHTETVRSFSFCKNDSILITAGYDGKMLVWSIKRSEEKINDQTEVVFSENNIPLVIKDRGVELQTTVTVHEPEFDIQIWDKSVEDGDSISLNLNGEWILRDHRVAKSRYTVHVKINPQFTNNYLILYAHNLGEISPNTAAVAVLIGGEEYRLSLSSDLKKSGALNFEYIPQ